MTRPLRIAHVAGTPDGAPWMVALIREQRRRGHDVTAVINSREGTLGRIFEEDGVRCEVTQLDLAARSSFLHAARTIRGLASLLARLRPDVVICHLFPSIISGRLASWVVDVPLRFSMIPGTLYLEAPILGDMEAGTAWADTKVIATCRRTRELYGEHGVALDHVEVLYYGVEPSKWDPDSADASVLRHDLGISDDTPLIGLVAYFYPPLTNAHLSPPHLVGKGVKGHETVLRAIPAVRKRYPEAKFVFVGRGWTEHGETYRQTVEQLARDLGVHDAVIFAGERTDIPNVLAAFDIALQVSLCENLGGSIEALMMQRPLIATRVGGLVDSVLHEETGLLIDVEDHEGLAGSIVRLLDDPALGARLAEAGRRFMLRDFTVQKLADDLDALSARELSRGSFSEAEPPREQRYRKAVQVFRRVQLPFRTARLSWLIASMRLRFTMRALPARLKRVPRAVVRRLTRRTAQPGAAQ